MTATLTPTARPDQKATGIASDLTERRKGAFAIDSSLGPAADLVTPLAASQLHADLTDCVDDDGF
jgi:hypothetical protein